MPQSRTYAENSLFPAKRKSENTSKTAKQQNRRTSKTQKTTKTTSKNHQKQNEERKDTIRTQNNQEHQHPGEHPKNGDAPETCRRRKGRKAGRTEHEDATQTWQCPNAERGTAAPKNKRRGGGGNPTICSRARGAAEQESRGARKRRDATQARRRPGENDAENMRHPRKRTGVEDDQGHIRSQDDGR